jgi:hypothetical protein
VITLGLTETWYDQLTSCYLNVPPAFEAIEREPKRFRFMRTSFNENLDALEKLYEFLMQRCQPSFRIIVTVSPVAPIATFGTQDVVISYTVGKSTLRAVAAEWSACHDNVEYFPAYEIILNSNGSVVFKQDRAHVTFRGSAHVVDVFERAMIEGGQPLFLSKERQRINSYEQYLELYKMLLSGERDNALQQFGLELNELRAEMLRWEHYVSENHDEKFRKDLWQLMGLNSPSHALLTTD